MSLNFCDLVVLGSDLSGLMAGALLAKRGLSVTILDDEIPIARPSVATGLDSKLFKSILSKLSISEVQWQNVQANPVSYQILFPEHRLDISCDPTLVFKELHREFPEFADRLESIYEEIQRLKSEELEPLFPLLPIATKKEKKEFLKKMKEFPDQSINTFMKDLPELTQAFLNAQIYFLGGRNLLSPALLQSLLLLPLSENTTFSLPQGLTELKKIFFDKIDYFGGTVQKGVENFEFLVERGHIKGIAIPQIDFVTRARYCISNINVQKAYSLLPKSFWKRGLFREAAHYEKIGEEYVVQYLTSQEILPDPIAKNLILVGNPQKPFFRTNYLEVNLHQAREAAQGELDTLITVTYLLPPDQGEQAVSEFEKIHDEIGAILKKLLPFSEGKFKRLFPRLQEGQDEVFPESADEYALFRKAAIKKPIYEPALFFPGPLSPHNNVFIGGPNVLDWLGMDGKVLTAQKLVDLIWKKELKLRKI